MNFLKKIYYKKHALYLFHFWLSARQSDITTLQSEIMLCHFSIQAFDISNFGPPAV